MRNEASLLGDLSGSPSCLDGWSAFVLLSSLPRQPSGFTLCHQPTLGAHSEEGAKDRNTESCRVAWGTRERGVKGEERGGRGAELR